MCWVQSRCRCWQGERNSSLVRCVYNYDWVKLYMRHTRCHFAQSTSQRWNCWSEHTRGLSQEASPCLQMAKNLAEQRQSSRNLCLPGRDFFNISNYVPELNLKAPICTSIHMNKIKSCLFFLHKPFFLAMKDKNNHHVDKYEIWYLAKQKAVYLRLYGKHKTCHTLHIAHESIESNRLSTFGSGSWGSGFLEAVKKFDTLLTQNVFISL